MQAKEPKYLRKRIHLIDGFDLGVANRTGTYVIEEEQLTLIETGPSPSVPYIKKGLKRLGYSLDQVNYLIVTHVHLDHAGGAGLLLQECPNATVVVHPRGARHLADPSRLVAGARQVYQEKFDPLFDPVIAIPEDRLLVKGDGDTLTIGPDCRLEFLDTPGHAKHHFSIYDPISHGMFTGDTVGIHYKLLADDGIDFFLPTTSPNHFNPDAMNRSIERIRKRSLDRLYFGHFGMTANVEEALCQVEEWLPIFVEEGKQSAVREEGPDALANRLLSRIKAHLRQLNVADNHSVYQVLELDMQVCAQGIVDYLWKQRKVAD
ncbi:MBL fold metallo-hydrolase [Tuberibacillus sp. Marseille-P3662]|uniref:MBL fold metallo-hydrolase n=1 Tax=Tuberibacillus sp. Marseille-P3662 TaxID=1965358 RepID=UPI000A1CD1EE|nr:MBL fold metallo-hydrolase [Tuberibacillus sp. Marseille-P3662]